MRPIYALAFPPSTLWWPFLECLVASRGSVEGRMKRGLVGFCIGCCFALFKILSTSTRMLFYNQNARYWCVHIYYMPPVDPVRSIDEVLWTMNRRTVLLCPLYWLYKPMSHDSINFNFQGDIFLFSSWEIPLLPASAHNYGKTDLSCFFFTPSLITISLNFLLSFLF